MKEGYIKAFLSAASSQYAFFVYTVSVLLALPIGEYLSQSHELVYLTQPVILEIAGIIGTVMVICSLARRRRFGTGDILLGLILLFMLLSLIFSEDRWAFMQNSAYGSSIWPTHIMAFVSLTYAASELTDMRLRKRLLLYLTAAVIIHFLPALLQTLGSESAYCYYDGDLVTGKQLAYGLTQHYVWFTALASMLICCPAVLGMFAETRRSSIAYLALAAAGFYVLFSADTWLSLLDAGVIFLLLAAAAVISLRKDKPALKAALARLGLLLLAAGAVLLLCIGVMGRFGSGIEGTVPEPVKEYEKEIASKTISLDRSELREYGLACLPDHWAFGVGFDNYAWCFTHAEGLEPAEPQSKAMSDPVQLLVTRGVFALAAAAALILYAGASGIRRLSRTGDSSERIVTTVFFAMFAVYAIQSLFNSSAVNTAPYFLAALGMLIPHSEQRLFGAPAEERGREE
ncbi:MAG: O-antigen ligase family protein [Ruminococcus sp.]|nr:O-antigen ligase family protein [Ruminococcus sp.]